MINIDQLFLGPDVCGKKERDQWPQSEAKPEMHKKNQDFGGSQVLEPGREAHNLDMVPMVFVCWSEKKNGKLKCLFWETQWRI